MDLARKYSAEDYAHGHGVQELRTDYFKTRDFTINETLVYGGWIYATKDCLLDTVRRILRFTDHELRPGGEDDEGGVRGKLLAKAVRLASEEIARGRKLEIKDKEAYQFGNIRPFNIALYLDRAFQKGKSVADEYVRQLVSLGQLPESIYDWKDAVGYLEGIMEEPFVFQYAPEPVMEADGQIDEIYRKFGHLIDKYEK